MPLRRHVMVRNLLLTAALSAIFVTAWVQNPPLTAAPFVTRDAAPNTLELSPRSPFVNSFASSDTGDYVHSAALAQLSESTLMSVWFAGSREGARDVQIRSARFDIASDKWDSEEILATRESTQEGVNRYIRKLGNPVIALAPDQRLWLFYVSVSVGGWGGSSVNAMVSEDMGKNWSEP